MSVVGFIPARSGSKRLPGKNVKPLAGKLTNRWEAYKHRVVTDAVHDAGGRIALQILHAGRYGYHPFAVAPSKAKSPITPFTPRALTASGVERTIRDFVRCAVLAKQAGYDGVEVMGSEGYLINEFLATRTNMRTDAWGGSYANRMRFPVEIVRRIRRIMPVYWIGVLLGLLFVAAERTLPSGDPLLVLHAAATPVQVLARLGGWSGLWPQEIFAGNYILHTVGTEIVIYAAYPLFFAAAAAGRWGWLAAGAVGLQLLTLPLLRYVDPFVLFPGVLAYFCWNRGVELVGANLAGQFMHLLPVFGSVLAILVLGEAFRAHHAAGAVLIFAGIVLATRQGRRARPA